MKIFFLGIMFCDESLKNVYKDTICGVSMAPHIFQSNLLQGFEDMEDVDIEVINVPPTGSFPINNRRIFSKSYRWGKNNLQVGYLNLPKIKWGIQKKKIIRELDERIHNRDDDVAVIAYSVYEPFLDIFATIKEMHPNIQLCLIQTDPIMGRGEREKYMTPAAIEEGNRIVKKAKMVDKFVLLTKYLSETIETNDRPYVVIECVCNKDQRAAEEGKKKNICLYTGTLNEEFGIKEMTDAFIMLKDAELWICGEGDTKGYIQQCEKKYGNIKYLGYLTREEIMKVQDDCDFLVNPRRPSGTYTMYSFPSKTAEYLMTGKPVIMYKLEGIPDEYDKYINYLQGSTTEDIARDLRNIFEKDYEVLVEKGAEARTFMINYKSANRQAKKILELLRS